MYRVGCVRQPIEFLLHLLQDVCGGAVLRSAMVNLVQDCIENLRKKNNGDLNMLKCKEKYYLCIYLSVYLLKGNISGF